MMLQETNGRGSGNRSTRCMDIIYDKRGFVYTTGGKDLSVNGVGITQGRNEIGFLPHRICMKSVLNVLKTLVLTADIFEHLKI